MIFLRSLIRYLHDYLKWITPDKAFLGYIFPFILLFLLRFTTYEFNNIVRYLGLFLETLGILTILIGLIGKRKLFSLPSFLEKIKIWMKSHPSWQPKIYNATGTFTSSNSIARRILGDWYLPESATVGGKLEAVEKNLLMIKNEIEINKTEAREKYSDLLKKLETDKRLMDSSLSDIHGRLENLAVGGITIEILGVWWLFSGLIFSSLPNEISIWIN